MFSSTLGTLKQFNAYTNLKSDNAVVRFTRAQYAAYLLYTVEKIWMISCLCEAFFFLKLKFLECVCYLSIYSSILVILTRPG